MTCHHSSTGAKRVVLISHHVGSVLVRTCDVEVRGQAFRRREARRPEERLHLEGVGHDDAEERPAPVRPPDGPRRALRDGGGGARHRDHQQHQRDAEERQAAARARHDR